MANSNKGLTEINPRTIILKKGCWFQTNTGTQRIKQEIQAKASPIFFNNNELRGYKFKNHLYEGVTYDLERIVVDNNE